MKPSKKKPVRTETKRQKQKREGREKRKERAEKKNKQANAKFWKKYSEEKANRGNPQITITPNGELTETH